MKKLLPALLSLFLCAATTSQAQSVSFQKAVPIWINDLQTVQNVTASFRVVIPWDGASDVLLRLTAHCDYRAFVNGQFLGHGPCVAGEGFYRVDEHALKPLLKKGDNLIAVEVAGYNIDNYYLLNKPSFFQGEITSGGKVLAATTSGKWNKGFTPFEGALLEQKVQNAEKYSFQRPQREAYNLKPGYQGWLTDANSPLFKPAKLEETDAKALIARRVKYPDYTIRRSTGSTYENTYKFECNTTGFLGAHFEVSEQARVVLRFDEFFNEDGSLVNRNAYKGWLAWELAPGSYDVEAFEPYTMQGVEVIVESGKASVSGLYLRQYVNSDVSRASFETDNAGINTIYKAAVETFKQNALDIFLDCPSRERAGWLCDSYFTSRVAFDLSGNTLIEKNFLENFLLPAQFPNIPEGMLPMCYPSDHVNGNFIPNWAMWFVIQLEEYVVRSGDRALIDALQPKVEALMEYFKRYENEYGMLESLEKWIFVEWSKANDFVQDVNYPTNMLYARMLDVAGKLYNRPALSTQAEKLRETIREQSFDGTFFIDNALRVDGKLVPQKNNRTETCQYYAFYLGVGTPELHPALWQKLLTEFGPQRQAKGLYPEIYPANAFIGTYLRLEILSHYGHAKQLVGEMTDQYLYMAEKTGTLWENITTSASCNHGFASHVAHVFYRDLLGFSKVDALGKKLQIVLNPTDLNRCSGTIAVGDETISLSWVKKGKNLTYSLQTPAGWQVDVENKTGLKVTSK